MNRKVRKFYDDRGLQTKKLIDRSRPRMGRRKIEYGMKRVYQRIQGGEEIKDIMIAINVWMEAEKATEQDLRNKELLYEEERIVHLSNSVRLRNEAIIIESAFLIFAIIAYLKVLGVF